MHDTKSHRSLANVGKSIQHPSDDGSCFLVAGLAYGLLFADAIIPFLTRDSVSISTSNDSKDSGLFFHNVLFGAAVLVTSKPAEGGPLLYWGPASAFAFPSRSPDERLIPIAFEVEDVKRMAAMMATFLLTGIEPPLSDDLQHSALVPATSSFKALSAADL